MDNPETMATRRIKIKQKHNTICVEHHYTQTNTTKVNKTSGLLQTIGGTDRRFHAEIVAYFTALN